jgi:2-phospho-L-lactate guanylyltransferase (CobY/MobA/RfbA family)
LIFTFGARQEARRRKLLPAQFVDFERAFHQRCLDSTLAAGRTSRCGLLVASPEPLALDQDVRQLPQSGASFGERLRHAHIEGHRQCTGPLIVVGSDIPDLTASHVGSALSSLENDPAQVVVGPSPDGGFYLIATVAPLPEDIWNRVRWRSRETLSTLLQALRDTGRSVKLLPPLKDLDRRADFHAWLATGRRVSTVNSVGRKEEVRSQRVWELLLGRLRHLLMALCQIAVPRQLGKPVVVSIPWHPGRAPPC